MGALQDLLDADLDRGATLLAALVGSSDPSLADLARRVAGHLLLGVARHGRGHGGRRRPARSRGWTEGELDVDRSLDALVLARASGRRPDPEDLVERGHRVPRHGLCLMVDHSGSMADRRVATAGVAAAAVATRVAPSERIVIGFARSTNVLGAPGASGDASSIVQRVLSLRGHGATDLACALTVARDQVARLQARRRTVVLLSDGRATVGGDPVEAGRAIEDLRVLAPADSIEDAAEFARRTGGRVEPVRGPSDVARALARLLRD